MNKILISDSSFEAFNKKKTVNPVKISRVLTLSKFLRLLRKYPTLIYSTLIKLVSNRFFRTGKIITTDISI